MKEDWLLRRALAPAVPTDGAQGCDAAGRWLPDPAVQLCLAALRGLREAVCARGERGMDVITARALWLAQPEATTTASARARSSATIASGSSAE